MADPTAVPRPIAPLPPRLPAFLWAVGLIAAAVLLVLIVGNAIDPKQPYAFDRALLLAMRDAGATDTAIGPAWLRKAMADVTALGGGSVLTLVVAGAVGMLLVARKWMTALLAIAGTVSGSTLVRLFKVEIDRPRPDVVPHLVEVSSRSFPSGHAANSAIVYLTLATLLAQTVVAPARRRYLFVVAALLVGLIGFSRIYLGVHWPTDVLAGWSFGILWAVAWWQIGRWLRVHAPATPALPEDER